MMIVCHIQHGLPVAKVGSFVNIHTVFHKYFNDFPVSAACRLMNGQPSILIMLVNHIGPMLRILNNVHQSLHVPGMRRVMRAITARPILGIRLVRPSRFPFLLGMLSSPLKGFEGSIDDVGWESSIVVETTLDVEHGFVVFFVVGVEAMLARVSDGFEVDEDIGIIIPLQRKRPSMQHTVTFIQNHLPRLNRHIVRLSIMSIHLERPRFLHILRHINNRRGYQRKPIDVRGQYGSQSVFANAVKGGGGEFLSRPFLEGMTGGFPDRVFECFASPDEFVVVYVEHPGGAFPMIGISIPSKPFLHLLLSLILIPKIFNGRKHLLRGLNHGKPILGIIHHTLRLAQIHLDSIALGLIALVSLVLLVISTSFHKVIIEILSIPQALDGHFFEFFGERSIVGMGWRGEGGIVVG
mmetsp:Transcript_38908/g.81775  ORF Transcript_38908/g.81775 Transcript_38908/m.81775 type:complete len:409 (+) Transcript_38908:1943-3169(+)